jgi:hypothetical protein
MTKRNSSSNPTLKWKSAVPQISAQAGDVIRVISGRKTAVYKCGGDMVPVTKNNTHHHLPVRQQKRAPSRPKSRQTRRNTNASGQ